MKIGRMKIVITEKNGFSLEAIERLKQIGNVFIFDCKTETDLLEASRDADVLFIRLRFKLTKSILQQTQKLKYILTATTGLDHIDEKYFESVGGKIISLRGETEFLNSIPSTAEHTWGLLLALMRHTPMAFNDVKKGFWRRDLFKGNNLKNKKIGILGLGRVGKQVAKYSSAFEMEVGYYDIEVKESNYMSLRTPKELFSWADIISIHIPLDETNHHFINKELLDNIQPGTIIVNTSRGAVIDEVYLSHLIETHKIRGYATDVLEDELTTEIISNKLVELSKRGYNVIITPHISGATVESMESTEKFIVEKFTNTFV